MRRPIRPTSSTCSSICCPRIWRVWPEDAWIAIDDYQHIRESATAEAFVEGIIQQSPVQVLISTRDRPSWVSTRSVLYGDVLEIGQSTAGDERGGGGQTCSPAPTTG